MRFNFRVVVLIPLLGVLGTHMGTADSEEFSRSAWIASQMDRVPFSGGVLPAPAELRARGRVESSALPESGAATRATPPKRVSSDILVDIEVGQPGTQAEPYAHGNPLDPHHLVGGWQENRHSDGGAAGLGVAVSFDRGRRWSDSLLPELTQVNGGEWERASDPWVEFGPDNRVYFSSLLFNETTPENAIGVSVSEDGGRTWGPPVEVFRSPFDFNDKEALTVDGSPASPALGNVYVAWDINEGAPGVGVVRQRLVVARSTNGGRSYHKPITVRRNGTNIGITPRVGSDGTLYVVWAGGEIDDEDRLWLYFARSTDGGKRFSEPRIIEDMFPLGVEGLRVGEILPSFAVDPDSGDLYVAWADSRWSSVDQAALLVSRDGGESWGTATPVSDAPRDAPVFTVSVAVNAVGDVGVSYYTLENDPQRSFLVDHKLAISDDGGASFQPSIRMNKKTFDVRYAALSRGYFLGDYVGLTAPGEDFYAFFTTTRWRSRELGTRQPDVAASRTK